MNFKESTHLTDEEIISTANFISTKAFLASNQTKARTDMVKTILAEGHNVAIVHWQDGAKAFIPIHRDQTIPSEDVLIKAYRMFHDALSNNPNLKGRVWAKV